MKDSSNTKTNSIDENRRGLLKIITTVAITSTAIGVQSASAAVSDEQIDDNAVDTKTGYHETQHIQDYYKTL